jgi:hypothetical protein
MARPIERSEVDEEEFWERVCRTEEGCWEWQGDVNPHSNRGTFDLPGKKRCYAYRVVYALVHGLTPADKLVCHHCDNPRCVRPDHLFLGTQKDNAEDCCRKGRQAKGDRHGLKLHPERVARGERHGSKHFQGSQHWFAILNEDKVRAIHQERRQGKSYQEIATLYGVTKGTVAHIFQGRSWKHVAPEDP